MSDNNNKSTKNSDENKDDHKNKTYSHNRNSKSTGGKKENSASNGTPKSKTKSVSKINEEVFLCLSLAVCGRSPLNGWIMNIGATVIAAEERKILGVFERNLLPLLPNRNVTPSPDVLGFWRRQRAELEYMYYGDVGEAKVHALPSNDTCHAAAEVVAQLNPNLHRVTAEKAMEDLKTFCAPYTKLTLVGNPLLSIYGWLTFYWSHVFPPFSSSSLSSSDNNNNNNNNNGVPMPWGFSGLCARSYASGCLGVSMKKLGVEPRYFDSFESFKAVGLPLADSVAAAVSFSHLHWVNSHPTGADGLPPTPPPVHFACEFPPLLRELGCVPDEDIAQQPCSEEVERGKKLSDLMLSHDIRCPAKEKNNNSASLDEGMHMHFTEYPSITDLQFNSDFVQRLPSFLTNASPKEEKEGADITGMEWVATEKVHGANFTIYTNGESIWAGKRTGLLSAEDSASFFEYLYMLQTYREAIFCVHGKCVKWLQEDLKVDTSAGVTVAIMCELAGGDYPHPAVPVDPRGLRVQRGVYYCPFNFLYGFDVAVDLQANDTATTSLTEQINRCVVRRFLAKYNNAMPDMDAAVREENISIIGKDHRYYLPFDVAQTIFKSSSFPRGEVIHRGSLQDLLQKSPKFTSTIAETLFDLPPLETEKNEAEGFVLRPVEDVWLKNISSHLERGGDAEEFKQVPEETDKKDDWSRVIIKRKHPKFSEFAHTTANNNNNNNNSNQVGDAQNNLLSFLTASRVESVLSKYTSTEQRDQAAMVQAVLEDARKDAAKCFKK